MGGDEKRGVKKMEIVGGGEKGREILFILLNKLFFFLMLNLNP